MQTSEIAAQVVALLAPVISGGVNVAQGVATRVLGDLISKRLSSDEAGKLAWSEFEQDPRNDSLVRHLLRQELERDAIFREQVARQLAEASHEPQQPLGSVKQKIGDGSHGNVQVGGSVDKIAHSGGHIDDSVHNTTHKKTSSGASVAGIVAIVVIVVLALVIYGGVKVIGGVLHKSAKDGGLTANSTCQQFLNTDEEDERQAIADIGLSMGYSSYSNPLALPEMQYECGGAPNQTLGERIQQDGPNG